MIKALIVTVAITSAPTLAQHQGYVTDKPNTPNVLKPKGIDREPTQVLKPKGIGRGD